MIQHAQLPSDTLSLLTFELSTRISFIREFFKVSSKQAHFIYELLDFRQFAQRSVIYTLKDPPNYIYLVQEGSF